MLNKHAGTQGRTIYPCTKYSDFPNGLQHQHAPLSYLVLNSKGCRAEVARESWCLREFLYRGTSSRETNVERMGQRKITTTQTNDSNETSSHTLSLKFWLASLFHRKPVLSKFWVEFQQVIHISASWLFPATGTAHLDKTFSSAHWLPRFPQLVRMRQRLRHRRSSWSSLAGNGSGAWWICVY